MHEKEEKKTVVLARVGTDFWSRLEIIIKEFKPTVLSREDKKLILARMIAANEYVEGKHSVEWVDFASSIKDIELTKELLKELKDNPVEMVWTPDQGWIQADKNRTEEENNNGNGL